MSNETYAEQWFSIGSAARKLDCHIDDVWHLIDTNKLHPLVKILNFVHVDFVLHPNKNSNALQFNVYLKPVDCFGPVAVNKYAFREHLNTVSGCFYLHCGNLLLDNGKNVDLRGVLIVPAIPSTGERIGTNIYKVIDSVNISSDDLIIPAPQVKALLTSIKTAKKQQTEQQPKQKTDEPTVFDDKYLLEYVKENTGIKGIDEMAYRLFEKGYQNNQIGVALGGTYRKDSHALVSWVLRLRKKYEKKLGNLTP